MMQKKGEWDILVNQKYLLITLTSNIALTRHFSIKQNPSSEVDQTLKES